MSRISYILGLIVAAITLVSCNDSKVESVENIDLVLENQSRYDITIRQSNNAPAISIVGVPQSITLNAGEKFFVDNVMSVSVCKAFGWVTYDNSVELDFFKDKPYTSTDAVYSPYDITRVGNYRQEQVGKTIVYTYTFTDADYQFALENGTKLE